MRRHRPLLALVAYDGLRSFEYAIAADLFAEMGRRDAEYGVVSMCVGGGQGMAALFRRS